jgi:hypothetical protein
MQIPEGIYHNVIDNTYLQNNSGSKTETCRTDYSRHVNLNKHEANLEVGGGNVACCPTGVARSGRSVGGQAQRA